MQDTFARARTRPKPPGQARARRLGILYTRVRSSIYMRAVYKELRKSGKKCEKLGKSEKK